MHLNIRATRFEYLTVTDQRDAKFESKACAETGGSSFGWRVKRKTRVYDNTNAHTHTNGH